MRKTRKPVHELTKFINARKLKNITSTIQDLRQNQDRKDSSGGFLYMLGVDCPLGRAKELLPWHTVVWADKWKIAFNT